MRQYIGRQKYGGAKRFLAKWAEVAKEWGDKSGREIWCRKETALTPRLGVFASPFFVFSVGFSWSAGRASPADLFFLLSRSLYTKMYIPRLNRATRGILRGRPFLAPGPIYRWDDGGDLYVSSRSIIGMAKSDSKIEKAVVEIAISPHPPQPYWWQRI